MLSQLVGELLILLLKLDDLQLQQFHCISIILNRLLRRHYFNLNLSNITNQINMASKSDIKLLKEAFCDVFVKFIPFMNDPDLVIRRKW